MGLLTLLDRATEAGMVLAVDNNRLIVKGPRNEDQIAHQLGSRKAELLPIIQQLSEGRPVSPSQLWALCADAEVRRVRSLVEEWGRETGNSVEGAEWDRRDAVIEAGLATRNSAIFEAALADYVSATGWWS